MNIIKQIIEGIKRIFSWIFPPKPGPQPEPEPEDPNNYNKAENYKILADDFKLMIEEVKSNPTRIYLYKDKALQSQYITPTKYQEIKIRWNKWLKSNCNQEPEFILINEPTPTTERTNFIMGYYINSDETPIDAIDFKALKEKGTTDVFVRATNTGSKGIIYTDLPKVKVKTDAAGLRLHAWVWKGFSYAEEVAAMGVNLHLDLETYKMAEFIPEIENTRNLTTGVLFTVCTKPDGWDGNQLYDKIIPHVDFIVPMLYLGDYGKSVEQLESYVKNYQSKFPGKLIPALETYISDKKLIQKKPIPKECKDLLTEINTVKPHVQGVILFLYGLTNF